MWLPRTLSRKLTLTRPNGQGWPSWTLPGSKENPWKCFYFVCFSAGKFSSDRTIAEYAREIWGMEPRWRNIFFLSKVKLFLAKLGETSWPSWTWASKQGEYSRVDLRRVLLHDWQITWYLAANTCYILIKVHICTLLLHKHDISHFNNDQRESSFPFKCINQIT